MTKTNKNPILILINNQDKMYENKYSHTDLYACAFMIAKGVNAITTEKINEYSSKFIMDCDIETGKKLYRRYRANEQVGVLDLKYSLRRAKDILFNNKDNE